MSPSHSGIHHGLWETSQGPMCIEGFLVPEKALDGPETYHLQHTSQGDPLASYQGREKPGRGYRASPGIGREGGQRGSFILDPGEGR